MNSAFESQRYEPLPAIPARGVETFARVIFAAAIAVLVYALWTPNLDAAAAWPMREMKELRVLPRMSVFICAGLMALIIQGARPRPWLLVGGAFAAFVAQVALLPWGEITQPLVLRPETTDPAAIAASNASVAEVFRGTARYMLLPGAFLDLLRFELSLLAAVLLGTWLGNGIRSSATFLMLLMCAAAGDVWLSYFKVPESVDPTHIIGLMRVPWPPPIGHLGISPAWTDLLFLSAVIAATRHLRFHMLSVILGSVAGYCGASFLALEPWPAWPTLSMCMFSSGILIGCWPDLRLTPRDIARAVIVAMALLILLFSASMIQKEMAPPPEPQEDTLRYRNFV